MRASSIGDRNMEAPRSAPAPSNVRAMMMVKAAPLAPVMSHFSPLMVYPPSASALAVVRRAVGSDPAPGGGSVIEKQERVSPASIGSRDWRRCASFAMRSSICIFPSSGAAMLRAIGPSMEYPAASKKTARVTCDRSASWISGSPESSPSCRARPTSSVRRPSVGPCGVRRSSFSYGMTFSATKSLTRACSSCSFAERAKLMQRRPATAVWPSRKAPRRFPASMAD
mmetsp:Transcript_33937/g.109632  ORF Transcript_33937/g.109632 Transcript_33937/m.109632 type:complete len:226 (+) Transcript_33937:1162-1839(+)